SSACAIIRVSFREMCGRKAPVLERIHKHTHYEGVTGSVGRFPVESRGSAVLWRKRRKCRERSKMTRHWIYPLICIIVFGVIDQAEALPFRIVVTAENRP